MIRPILRYGERPLHETAADVTAFDDNLQQLVDDMIETMYAAPGVGLAATQIGVPLRVFVIDLTVGRTNGDLIVMVNPTFVSREGTQIEEEGCLSAPGFNATVVRPRHVVVKGLDRHGEEQTIEGKDLLARAFQHEMDHLDGVVFIDRLRGIKREMIVRKIQKLKKVRQVVSSVPGSLRIVFFGTPAFAVPSLQALIQSAHQVLAVVSQPDRPKGRGHEVQATATKTVADTHGIPVLQPAKIRDEAFLQQIHDLGPDLGVVVAFGRILPDALLAIPRLGMINVHASILPRYRGAAPIQRAVLAGDPETGVTIMRVITEMDAGPTFAVASVPIPRDATSGDMEGTLAHLGAQRLLPVVDDLAAGRAVETPQDASRATHAAKITKAEGAIDWTEPASTIHDKVRGLQPWPLASTRLAGERLVLRGTVPGVRSGLALVG